MASVWEAMKKHQAEQAAAQAAASDQKTPPAPGTPAAAPKAEDIPRPTAPTDESSGQHNKQPLTVPVEPAVAARVAETVAASLENTAAGANAVARAAETAASTRPAHEPRIMPAPAATKTAQPKYAELLRPHFDRGGRIAEEYRALRTNLLAQCGEKGFCYLVTSAQSGEGKTITVLNLALVMAECVTQNVLVIDADMRQPRIGDLMGLSPTPGLAEVLRGQTTLKQAIQATSYPNVSVIAAGQATGDEVPELLSQPPLHNLLTEAKRMYDYVLVDTPPINVVSDVGTLGRFCSQALMVVRLGKTKQDEIDRAIALLRAANIVPAGMVLTGSREGRSPYPYRQAS